MDCIDCNKPLTNGIGVCYGCEKSIYYNIFSDIKKAEPKLHSFKIIAEYYLDEKKIKEIDIINNNYSQVIVNMPDDIARNFIKNEFKLLLEDSKKNG